MMIEVNSFLFYTVLSSYISWFKHKETKYIGYVNSTINSTLIVLLEKYSMTLACKLYMGYLIYDLVSIINNLSEYKNSVGKQFIFHHVLCIYFIYNNYELVYPEYTSKMIQMERTLPIMNLTWFCYYHKIENIGVHFLKLLTVILYTYYRIYICGMLNYENYINGISYKIQFITWCIYMMNIKWYMGIVNMVKKTFNKLKIKN